MTLSADLVAACRRQFPALARKQAGERVVFLDGPAGTQVPQCVLDAISGYLTHNNANHGGRFATSRESDAMLDEAHRASADLLGVADSETVFFGPNMTTLTFALSRALARTWRPGDEVLVTRLDHDANVTPWVLAARDAGATVRFAEVHCDDCTLDLDQLRGQLNERTRLVAIGCASNAVGSINPVQKISQWAHDVGALVFLDAVHYAPHAKIDVPAWGCDFLACSAYKFFGPHIGLMWGRRELLESLDAYKLRPAPDTLPGKWMTGTQNHECIAGTLAAIDYLASLGRQRDGRTELPRREALTVAFDAIGKYESGLCRQLLDGLARLESIRVWGITSAQRMDERLPTVSITHDRLSPQALADALAQRGLFVWHGNYYALQLSETLDREPEGMVRLGLVHYNTSEEVDRLLDALRELVVC